MSTAALIHDVDGDLFIGASRVLLENVVITYRQGRSAELDDPVTVLAAVEAVIGLRQRQRWRTLSWRP